MKLIDLLFPPKRAYLDSDNRLPEVLEIPYIANRPDKGTVPAIKPADPTHAAVRREPRFHGAIANPRHATRIAFLRQHSREIGPDRAISYAKRRGANDDFPPSAA